MQYTDPIDNRGILEIIRRSCSYVDARLMNHGYRVAYIVSEMLKPYFHDDARKIRDVCFLALLHDIGAYKTDEISKMLQFDTDDVLAHSVYGYLFIKYFSPLKKLAGAILLHHAAWQVLENLEAFPEEIRLLAQVLHAADRIDVAMEVQHLTWEETLALLKKDSGTNFAPVITDLAAACDFHTPFEGNNDAEALFFQMLSEIPLTQDEITDYLNMLIFTIDFRSRHTVTHTITTTTISSELAKRMGLSEKECNQVVCGSMLHDLGKIGIPVEILEYPGKLSPQAMNIMRTHVDITEKIFGDVIEETVKCLALRHHEKLDGSGYPRGLTAADLSTGERIVAIADIISALSGTRSYKTAFSKDRICSIITEMKDDGLIDADIVELMISDYDEIMEATRIQCQPILDIYARIQQDFDRISRAMTMDDIAGMKAVF